MHNVSNMLTITDFLINQDVIAKTLCVQKEEQKGCNGKCHLRQELAKNNPDTNSEAPSENNKRLTLDAFQISPVNQLTSIWLATTYNKQASTANPIHFKNLYLDIDTPPPNYV
ncbi:hypothetical protein [Formosa sp. A9]|uniref:hypothetical protein n=1 Tax=Formosa sp. A9 TaxID=3442641 RepID=UPI003EC00CC6